MNDFHIEKPVSQPDCYTVEKRHYFENKILHASNLLYITL
jgi:hypothetical protein